jgi:hypothetical protein
VAGAISRSTWAVLSLALCSGCYPSIAVVRPSVELAVREARSDAAAGAPVPNVRVTLATYTPDGPTLESFTSDAAGRLKLRAKREPTVRVVLGDYFWDQRWALCLEKPGYLAYAVAGLSATQTLDVRLERASGESTCEWPREYGGDSKNRDAVESR